MKGRFHFIVNPVAGTGKGKKVWRKVKNILEEKSIAYSFSISTKAGQERELTHDALSIDPDRIIVVGGDGTLHHVCNQILIEDRQNEIEVGLIPVGTGNDWAKMYSIPHDPKRSLSIALEGKQFLQDVGEVSYDGGKLSYFINIAGTGFDAYLIEKLGSQKTIGKNSYLLGMLRSLWTYKNQEMQIVFDDHHVSSSCFLNLVTINQYGGGGMHVAPLAKGDDGLLDVTLVKDIGKIELLLNILKLYNGRCYSHPKVDHYRVSALSIIPASKKVKLEVDGELLGSGPYRFSISEKRIKFITPG